MKCRLAEVDDFIAGLWNIHVAVKKEGFAQVNPPSLSILSVC